MCIFPIPPIDAVLYSGFRTIALLDLSVGVHTYILQLRRVSRTVACHSSFRNQSYCLHAVPDERIIAIFRVIAVACVASLELGLNAVSLFKGHVRFVHWNLQVRKDPSG